jgi:hypothetical protein
MMSIRVTMGRIRIPGVSRGAQVVFVLQETAVAR